MTSELLRDVSDTALWVATYRADESRRPDALFHDPLANVLIGERGRKIAERMKGSRYTAWSVVMRTSIIDTYIRELVAQGVDTIINLGAGLDTRPYRLGLPQNVRWIEVDFPHLIALKYSRLSKEKPTCNLERRAIDLANHEERKKLLAEINASPHKIAVLTEGVVLYLSEEEAGSLADDLHSCKNIRYWISDYFDPKILRHFRKKLIRTQMQNAPIKFSPASVPGFYLEHGFRVRETRYFVDESLRVGRPIPLPWWATVLRFIFRPKMTKESYPKLAGYMLLEPTSS